MASIVTFSRITLNVIRKNLMYVKCYSSETRSLDQVRTDLETALQNFEDVELTPLRLIDGSFGKNFTDADVKYDHYFIDKNKQYQNSDYSGQTTLPIIDFAKIYKRGLNCLQKFVTDGIDLNHDTALFELKHFMILKDYHECAFKCDERDIFLEEVNIPASEAAVVLTNHLLSRLMYGHRCIIRNDYSAKPLRCPCLQGKCREKVDYGEIALGYEKLWFGRPDVVLLPEVNIKGFDYKQGVIVQEHIYTSEEEDEETNEDIHKFKLQSQMSQFIAQTITSSLYQTNYRKRSPQPEPAEVSLIPSLMLSPSDYIISMYDTKHDVLLCSEPLQLWDCDRFNMSAILHIWMVLNHMSFNPSLPADSIPLLENSGNFLNFLKLKFPMFAPSEKITYKRHFESEKGPVTRKFGSRLKYNQLMQQN